MVHSYFFKECVSQVVCLDASGNVVDQVCVVSFDEAGKQSSAFSKWLKSGVPARTSSQTWVQCAVALTTPPEARKALYELFPGVPSAWLGASVESGGTSG